MIPWCSCLRRETDYPNIRLDENLPVVNVGNREHPSYLPAEACGILRGQPIGRKLSPDQTRRMIEFACRTPKANADFIVKNGKALLGLSGPKTSLVSLSCSSITMLCSSISGSLRSLGWPIFNYGGS